MDKRTLFWLIVALNVTDCVLTTLVIQAGGIEANEIVRWYLVHLGPWGVAVPKMLPILALGVIVYNVRLPLLNRALYMVTGIYAGLVVYQIGLLT